MNLNLDYNEIATLVTRVKQNDIQAFALLYERTYPATYFIALSILKNEQDAQDAAQDTYIKILSCIHNLENEKLYMAWSNRITYRISLRVLRKRTEGLVEGDWDETINDLEPDPELDPLVSVIKDEQKKELVKSVQQLDPVLRTTVMLKYFEKMPLFEIALVMDCPIGTVKSRLHTAKKLLKASVARSGDYNTLLGLATIFSLYGIYQEAAQSIGMSSQTALETLTNSLAHQRLSLLTPLAPTGSAAVSVGLSVSAQSGTPASISAAAASSTAASGAAVSGAAASGAIASSTLGMIVATVAASLASVALGASIFAAPSISQVIMPTPYVLPDATVIVETQSVLPVAELYAIAPDGSMIMGSSEENGRFKLQVVENGNYEIHVVSTNQKQTIQTVAISFIDRTAPKIHTLTQENDCLRVYFTDVQSGPNLNTVYVEPQDGTQVFPISVDAASNSVLFPLPEDSCMLYIADMLGNFVRTEVVVQRTTRVVP